MTDSVSEDTSRLKRRTLLATMGLSAVAGCGSNQQVEPPDEPEPNESAQDDCIERSKYEELQNQYEELKAEHETLQRRCGDSSQHALLPPYIENKRRKSIVTFETTTGEIESWEWDSSALESQNAAGNAIRNMTYSQLVYLGWDQYGFDGLSKYRQLGEYGEYYQLNPFVIPSNFKPIAEDFYSRHESDLDRIREAWNFITQSSDYVADIGETPRFPLETLLFGGGDCEDSCILLGSILYSMPGSIRPNFVYIDIDHPNDPQEINHVLVGAETDDGRHLIETTADTMLPFDGVEGFSIEITPPNSAIKTESP